MGASCATATTVVSLSEPNCNSSAIERSWISGSAWHGIRYDHASPRIERNVISSNARSGIYASGATAAEIRRNLFAGNEMGGVSCWGTNKDTITANLFAGNLREGLMVIDSSTPTVSENWFKDEVSAVVCASTGSGAGPGDPTLIGNRFTNNEITFQSAGKASDLPQGNLVVDDPVEAEFDASAYRPLDDLQQAAAYFNPDMLTALQRNLTWAQLLPEETLIIPQAKTRNYKDWNKSGVTREQLAAAPLSKEERQALIRETHQAIKPWVDDAFQLDDVAKRGAVIEEVRAALKSDNPSELRKGLVGFTALGQIRFDKASFHDLFLPVLKSEDPSLRVLAGQSLLMSGIQEGDIERFIALTEDKDSEVRGSAGSQLIWALEKDLTGESGTAILKLLNDPEPEIQRGVIHSLWGAKFSPAIEARVIELSKEEKVDSFSSNGIAYDALYYALSPQPNKSEASVTRLIDFLAAKDTHNVGGRAAWGLGQGVAKEQEALVAHAALKVVAARTQSYLFNESMKLLNRYATPEQADGIEALLAKPGVDGDFRKGLEGILARLGGE